jgi:MFS family permease
MDAQYPARIRRSALLIASLSSFITPFMGSAVFVATPIIGNEFGVDAVTAGWVTAAYLLAAAMFLVPFGKIADIHGRKRVFTYGILLDTIASILCAASVSVPLLISFRFLQGFGDAMIFGTSIAILIVVYPFGQRGKVLGISTAATYIGLSLGPLLGGFLTQSFGWRSIFIFIMILDLAIVALLFAFLKGEWVGAKEEKFDFAGSTIYALTILAIVFGLTILPYAFTFTLAVWLVGGGVAGLGSFILLESRRRYPVLNMKFFRHNAVFAFSNLAALINYMATFAVTFIFSFYLEYPIRDFGPFYAGLVLVSQPAMMAILSYPAGWLSDRIEPRIVASVGMSITTLGLYLLSFVGLSTQLIFIVVGLLVFGIGFGFFSSPNTNAVMSSVEREFYGVASATLGTMRLVGQSMSLTIALLFLGLIVGNVPLSDPSYPTLFTKAMGLLLITLVILCFFGIFASLARGRVRHKNITKGLTSPRNAKKP